MIERPIIESTVPMYDTPVRATPDVVGGVGSGLMSYRGEMQGCDTGKTCLIQLFENTMMNCVKYRV